MKRLIFSLLLLAGCASTGGGAHPSAAPVAAAELAFAADAGERGWIPAFRSSVAPDGKYLRPGLVSAPEHLAAQEDDGFKGLQWRPDYVGIAASGDIGFSTGPVFFEGREGARLHYFTIWRQQPDGAWKWIFDGGVRVVDANPLPANEPVPEAAPSIGSSRTAAEDVRAIEARLASDGALAARFAEDVRMNRAGAPQARGRAAAQALLAAGAAPRFGAVEMLEASAAGDFVFTLGAVTWRDGAAEKQGNYTRVWQHRAEGWRIVFDQIIPFGE